MSFPSPWCIWKALWYFLRFPSGAPTAGHSFIEEGTYTGCEVQVLKCKDCGKVSIGWRRV
jgi:hypothetical protein